MTSIDAKAYAFAYGAHAAVGQKRRYSKDDYIIHPWNVVRILDTVIHASQAVRAAAFLHDVLEDTEVTFEQIHREFGSEIADLVAEVTDVSTLDNGNRAARKRIDREHLAQASADGQNIKIADLIDNTCSIVAHDPKFAKIYLPEKRLVLDVMSKANGRLIRLGYETLERSEADLGLTREI